MSPSPVPLAMKEEHSPTLIKPTDIPLLLPSEPLSFLYQYNPELYFNKIRLIQELKVTFESREKHID